MTVELAVVLVLILMAEFVNGWTDAPNAIATVVSTRSLSPRQAISMAAIGDSFKYNSYHFYGDHGGRGG